MIDWLNLIYNIFWVLGLSIALAVLSWSGWLASNQHSSLKRVLQQTGPQRGLMLSGFLFSLGLGLTTAAWYEKAFWFFFTAYFLYKFVMLSVRNASPDA